MPDCHAGSGCTIGTVIKVEGRIVPNTVGVDIGCGMLVAEFGQIELDLKKLDEVVNTLIPSGFNIHETPVTEFEGLSQLRCLHSIDQEKALCAIGSLGGGNHFIEANKDGEGNVYIVIHSGSRNLGVKVCGHYQQFAVKERTDNSAEVRALIERLKSEGRAREISEEIKKVERPKVVQELAWISGETLNDYLHDMAITQQYAQLNRETMLRIICQSMSITPNSVFQTIHNYIDISETDVILRKGAVSAKKGEQLIIPMNMRDGSLICEGKGNADWLYSAPHGAGRLMSRTAAHQAISLEQFHASMKGIYTTSVCTETIDESPMAYKPMQEIIECVQPTVEIKKIIKPVYNFKAKG
jgi:RNA-splicing ligase RtcB